MSFSFRSYFDSFLNWETRLAQAHSTDFSLARVHRLLTALGQPDDRLKFIHVAGSKGKGSTCVMLAEILRASGYRVGLFTSPHLYDWNERIRVLEPGHTDTGIFEGAIDIEDLQDRVRFYQKDIDDLRAQGVEVTLFEVLTALALTYFENRKCQIVVLETGLGGRLDATNAVDTMVCGITPIGLEHQNILGDSIEKIAVEKAGIIKSPDQSVVMAPQIAGARDVILQRSRTFGISAREVGKDLEFKIIGTGHQGSRFFASSRREYPDLFVPLSGAHQVENAMMALGMAEELEKFAFVITPESVRQGLSQARWPARFEIIGNVILDSAHTSESIACVVQTFQQIFPGKKATVIFGTSTDKDDRAMVQQLQSICSRSILTQADHPRAKCVKDIFWPAPVERTASLQEAMDKVRGDEHILVCGSLFLAAQARALVMSTAGV